jgi:hypothetical protein
MSIETVIKKHLGYANTSNLKYFTEEVIAPKSTQLKNLLLNYIPKHAPTFTGVETNIIADCYSPDKFNANDANCPIGFQNYVMNSPYSQNYQVRYQNRYWKAIAPILSTDIPSISPKWLDVTKLALSSPLRKRWRVQLSPVPVGTFAFQHDTPPLQTGLLQFNNRIDMIQYDGILEVLPGDNIHIPTSNAYVKVVFVIGNKIYIYKLDPTDELYEIGRLPLIAPVPNSTTFVLYPKINNYLVNMIDLNQDNEKTYTPLLTKADGSILPFGLGDYYFDADAGIVTFDEFLPTGVSSIEPPMVSHYQFVQPIKFRDLHIRLDDLFFTPIMQLIGQINIDTDKFYLAFDFSCVADPGLVITIEFFDFETDTTLGLFNINVSTQQVREILVIDKFIGNIEIRGKKSASLKCDHMNLTLL